MKTQRFVIPAALLAALVAAPALAGVQGDTKPPPAKPQVDKEAKPASMTKPASMELSLPVTGLTKENAAQVQTALKGLTATVYECPQCDATMAKSGECSHCKVALVQKTQPMFETTTPAAEKSTLTVNVAGGQTVRLSQIEGALRQSSVQVDRKALKIQGRVALVFRGAASKDQATKLQEAAVAAKMTDAKATYEPDTKEIHVRLNSGSATWENATALGSKVEPPVTLADVQWSAAKPRS
jgi:hypothetical protein